MTPPHVHLVTAGVRYGGLADASPLVVDRAVAASASGITIADATRPGFPLTYVNHAFEALTGYRADECIGRNCRFLQSPETARTAIEEIRAGLRESREVRVVLLNRRKDGTLFHNELRLSPVCDEEGRVVQVIGVQHDVSALVLEQQELDRARDELEALVPPVAGDRPGLDLDLITVLPEEGDPAYIRLVVAARESTVLVVGEALGHRDSAARRGALTRLALAMYARLTDDPRRLLVMANHALLEGGSRGDEPVTAVCASYDPATRRLRWAAAGQVPPTALDTGVSIGDPAMVGVPLGTVSGGQVASGETRLAPGDGVVLHADGERSSAGGASVLVVRAR